MSHTPGRIEAVNQELFVIDEYGASHTLGPILQTVDKTIHEGLSPVNIAFIAPIDSTAYDRIGDSEDNAARLALCWNAHDDLVAALETAKETIKAWHGDDAWDLYQQSPEMQQITAALSKATPAKEQV